MLQFFLLNLTNLLITKTLYLNYEKNCIYFIPLFFHSFIFSTGYLSPASCCRQGCMIRESNILLRRYAPR